MKGIKRVELEHVIDFLYNGEANIAQEELTLFLDTAQELNLKGLQNGHQEGRGSEQFGPKYSEEELPAKVGIETNNIFPTEQIIEQSETNYEPQYEMFNTGTSSDVALIPTGENESILQTNDELELQIDQMVAKTEGLWQCKQCGKTTKFKSL